MPLLNYMHNNVYELLGEYAYKEIFNEKLPKTLSYLEQYIKPKKIIKKINIFKEKERGYASLAIMLLTHSDFVIDKLKELYDEPIYHDEFGEGFDGEYNDETDDFDEPEIKESFASYFITIEGVDFHFGYDHRGLTVEVKKGTKVDDLVNALKKFLYLCYTNNDKL